MQIFWYFWHYQVFRTNIDILWIKWLNKPMKLTITSRFPSRIPRKLGPGICTDNCYPWLSLFFSLSLLLHSSLFTHFMDSQQANFYILLYFGMTRRNRIFFNNILFLWKLFFRCFFCFLQPSFGRGHPGSTLVPGVFFIWLQGTIVNDNLRKPVQCSTPDCILAILAGAMTGCELVQLQDRGPQDIYQLWGQYLHFWPWASGCSQDGDCGVEREQERTV